MSRAAPTPLRRALDRFAGVLGTRGAARRWYESYVATLGARAVVDTCNEGSISWVHRRAAGSDLVLPLPTAHWAIMQSPERLLEGIEIHDGRQGLGIFYDEDGRIAERSLDDRFPGRLVELARELAGAQDAVAASVAFVAGLDDERHGPGRVHYPVPVPGGVIGVWRTGLKGCRQALFDGRVPGGARFLVADGLEGAAVGWGATREEAEADYTAQVSHALPEQRRTLQTITDDYDDEGNLIARGALPPGLPDPAAPPGASTYVSPPYEAGQTWRPQPEGGAEGSPWDANVDPVSGRIEWGPVTIRGPASDAGPAPRRPGCVPHVVLPLEPSPERPPPRGRWIRLLGETGVTRHVVRVEEREGFLLVGADLLGLVDLRGLGAELDRIAVHDPELPGSSEYERFVRYRAHQYRWSPAIDSGPEGLVAAGGGRGPRFEAGGLDGDALQAMVYRLRRVLRPVD